MTLTIDQFAEVLNSRIPTPAEFIGFARGMGWRFRAGDRPALIADLADPLAHGMARMLSREPYRTNVLAELAKEPPAVPAVCRPSTPARPVPTVNEDGSVYHRCRTCGAAASGPSVAAVVAHCRAARDGRACELEDGS